MSTQFHKCAESFFGPALCLSRIRVDTTLVSQFNDFMNSNPSINNQSDVRNQSGSDGEPTERRIRQISERLHEAIRSVTEQIPGATRGAQQFARQLKMHRTLAGRLLNALRSDDPLAAISRMPRSEGLRIFLNAAKGSASEETIERAIKALRELEDLVHGELGGWDGFDAAVSEWLPDVREKFEMANKQLAFKAISNIHGVRADVQLTTSIYYPDASGSLCDIAIIEGLSELRRLRPGTQIAFAAFGANPNDPQPLVRPHQAGVPAEQAVHPPLLPDFCSPRHPPVKTITCRGMTHYLLAGDEIGSASAVDVYTASVIRGVRPCFQPRTGPHMLVSGSTGASVPVKTLLFNLLVHEDVWRGCDPELIIYDTHQYGFGSPNDPTRDVDRLKVMELIQYLGKGITRFRATEVGRHVEMVQHVCDLLGWDSDRLRGYRCRIEYPMLHAQYSMVFDPPPAPDDGQSDGARHI